MSKRKDLDTWQDFESEIAKIRAAHRVRKELVHRLLFRGQSDAEWQLLTTLERHRKTQIRLREYFEIIASLQPEIETFTQNRWEIPEYEEMVKPLSDYGFFHTSPTLYRMYGYMAHLRHHGFPSPLLDWTRSARVAAYFAFAGATEEKRVSIYVLSEARIHSGSSREPEIFALGPRVKTHRRHFLQQCEYTICGAFRDREWWIADHNSAFEERYEGDDIPVNFANYHFTLPATEKFRVLQMLDDDNVNAFSLFGSEDSLMETLALREFHFPDPYFGES